MKLFGVQIDVRNAGEVDVRNAGEVDVRNAGEVDVRNGGEVEVRNAGEVEVRNAGEVEVRNAGEVEPTRRNEQSISDIELQDIEWQYIELQDISEGETRTDFESRRKEKYRKNLSVSIRKSQESSRNKQYKRGTWSEDEHRSFLAGLKKLGKGNWKAIASKYVGTRSPSQVASHAQKYYNRFARSKRRASVFDILLDSENQPSTPSNDADQRSYRARQRKPRVSWVPMLNYSSNDKIPVITYSMNGQMGIHDDIELDQWPDFDTQDLIQQLCQGDL